jgi:hypothetical protein
MIVELKITFDPATKQVQVSGPINDKMLAYSMLEMARDAIKDHIDAQKQPTIVPAVFSERNGR